MKPAFAIGLMWSALALVPAVRAADLLPDLVAWKHNTATDGNNPNQSIIYGGQFDTSLIKNRVLYVFSAALLNLGEGPLQVIETTAEVNGVKTTQTITQQVLQDDDSFRDMEIGTFDYPPEVPGGFGHLRLPGLAQYNLYQAIDNGGGEPDVGPLAASNDKLSMGIVDSIPYNMSVPGMPANRVYNFASAPVLGISIGYADLYSAGLPGQWIDVTGVPSGQYWLEVNIDPYDRVLELDDSNNSTSILVDLTIPAPQIHPGDYNDDGLVDLADYTVWRDTLGDEVARGTAADGDGDGVVTLGDYTEWKAHFGEVASAAATSNPVPEPSSLWLIACVLLLARPRR